MCELRRRRTPTTSIMCLIIFIIWIIKNSESCSCKLEHPQGHFCTADYVIVARIKNVQKDSVNANYTIKVNKIFKKTEKAQIALQQKTIYSPLHSMLCGVQLEKRKSYLLAGRVIEGKLRIVICDYYEEWTKLTLKQKKGFKLLYEKGCNCQITPCPWWNRRHCLTMNESKCVWETLHEGEFDCQGLSSVCMKQSHGKCGWNYSQKYRHCMKLRKEHKEKMRALEP